MRDTGERNEAREKPKRFRELFVEELAEVRGGEPDIALLDPLKPNLCAHYTTMARGEEKATARPSGWRAQGRDRYASRPCASSGS